MKNINLHPFVFFEKFILMAFNLCPLQARGNFAITIFPSRAIMRFSGRLAQLVRAPRLHRGGRGFESLSAHHFFFVIPCPVFFKQNSTTLALSGKMKKRLCSQQTFFLD